MNLKPLVHTVTLLTLFTVGRKSDVCTIASNYLISDLSCLAAATVVNIIIVKNLNYIKKVGLNNI